MDELQHYGTPRHSGRYPWGSGKNPQRNKNFTSYVKEMKKQGMTESEIAKALIGPKANSSDLRAKMTIASNELLKENMDRANKLREKGYSPTEIGRIMKRNESTVRSWLNKDVSKKKSSIFEVSDILRKQVEEKKYLDIGSGVELSLGVARTKMNDAVSLLKEEGYKTIKVQVDQMGTAEGMKTTVLVLAPPGTTYKDVNSHKDQIRTIEDYIQEGNTGISRMGLPPVNSISSDRIKVIFAEDGGTKKDGVIELRRGLNDLSLGNANYAQVRIGVDGTHYLKGMAMYSDNMPDGVDVIFNTNKTKDTPLTEVFKKMKRDNVTGEVDKENPFGASIKPEENLKRVPRYYTDENGKQQVSPINVVNEEGDWEHWSKTLASQMLAKQPNQLVRRQLQLSYDIKRAELDDILSITNPVVKKKLLESYASDCDSTAVHLKAAALPRQSSHVILPLPDIKENEIYAPRYKNGESVALVRYPHGGTFEIPVLKVNNKVISGRNLIGNDSPDAVGIHPSAAVRLSGADFDGDTVLVIPTGGDVKIKSTQPLKGLVGFDERKDDLYKINRDDPKQAKLPKIAKGSRQEQTLMGTTTNLITDMIQKGANDDEVAAAVRHSMVVIDTAKHDLDYKKSERDNHIKELKKLYQIQPDGRTGGASTILSRAKSEVRVNTRVPDKEGTGNSKGWDPETGEVRYVEKKGDTFIDKDGKVKHREIKSTQMMEARDARELVSTFNTPNERAYADYANQLKGLANEARKEYLVTKNDKKDPAAAKAYEKEVASLNSKLNVALKNSPRERQAQLYADKSMEMRRQAMYPAKMEKDDEKKYRAQALAAGRARFNANKNRVKFSEKEWEAVQAHAISPSRLDVLLNNADMDDVKKLAIPRTSKNLTKGQEAAAKSMRARGFTLEEIGERFGVSSSTISNAIG